MSRFADNSRGVFRWAFDLVSEPGEEYLLYIFPDNDEKPLAIGGWIEPAVADGRIDLEAAGNIVVGEDTGGGVTLGQGDGIGA